MAPLKWRIEALAGSGRRARQPINRRRANENSDNRHREQRRRGREIGAINMRDDAEARGAKPACSSAAYLSYVAGASSSPVFSVTPLL